MLKRKINQVPADHSATVHAGKFVLGAAIGLLMVAGCIFLGQAVLDSVEMQTPAQELIREYARTFMLLGLAIIGFAVLKALKKKAKWHAES